MTTQNLIDIESTSTAVPTELVTLAAQEPGAKTREAIVPQLTYLLCIEGKELAIDAEIAADDDSIRMALATAYPEITTAEVTRTTKDGQQRITVIKRGGPKGAGARVKTRPVPMVAQPDGHETWRMDGALQRLKTAPRRFNPLIAVHHELEQQRQAGQLDLITLMLCQGQIEQALIEGPQEAHLMVQALTRLVESPTMAWRRAPMGF